MFPTIVVGYDPGPTAADALALARLLALRGSRVIVTQVCSFDPVFARPGLAGWGDRLRHEAEQHLATAPLGGFAEGVEVHRHVVPTGSAARGLHDVAEERGADLIVLGSTCHGALGRVLPGTTADAVLRAAPCAVAVAPRDFAESGTDALRVIGLAYDGSAESDLALAVTADLARDSGAAVRVVTVVTAPATPGAGLSYGYEEAAHRALDDAAQRRLDTAVERLGEELRPLPVKRRGDPATAIAEEAEKGMDLLVVGSRGYGPVLRVLLGGVSSRLLRLAPCPVLIAPRGVDRPAAQRPAEPSTASISSSAACSPSPIS